MEKITERELQVFSAPYFSSINRLGFSWYYTNMFRLQIKFKMNKDKEINIKAEKFNGSLIRLLVLMENVFLRDYKEIDIYEGIATITNNWDFSEKENYYLLSNGDIIRSYYHKYYRAAIVGHIEIPKNINWDGKFDDELIKKMSKKLVERIQGV